MSNKEVKASGGMDFIKLVMAISAIAGVQMWSQGADPRDAAAAALVFAARVTGVAWLLIALALVAIAGTVWWVNRRGW